MQATLESNRTLTRDEQQVLGAVGRSGTLSRAEVQERLGMSRATVAGVVGQLVERGILTEAGIGDSEGGRRPQLFARNGNFGFVVGVDIGATSIDIALADFNNRVVERYGEAADVRESPELLLTRVGDLILELLARHAATADHVLAIGIGVPGPVNFEEGVLSAPPLMPLWEAFSIRDYMRRRFPKAGVVIDNDVNVMAMGEARAGAAQGIENFLYLKIGTGIGCGIISAGQIHRGRDGAAGDVGHICIDYNGPICHCGNAGCLEMMAAGPAIATRGRDAAESGKSDFLARRLVENGELTAADVGDAAKAGDRAANEIVNLTGKMIGGMVAGLVNFFNPHLIYIGGGISNLGNRFLSAIHQAVLRRSTALATRHLRIEFSPLGADAGVMGAIALAMEHVFEVEA